MHYAINVLHPGSKAQGEEDSYVYVAFWAPSRRHLLKKDRLRFPSVASQVEIPTIPAPQPKRPRPEGKGTEKTSLGAIYQPESAMLIMWEFCRILLKGNED